MPWREREDPNRSERCAERLVLGKKRRREGRVEREAVFHPRFREDLRHWVETDRAVALRAFELIEATLRDPFTGIGKPEPLRYELSGAWSRRLTREHRIVYLVTDDRITFLQARHHY
jgi:toxin YoeB